MSTPPPPEYIKYTYFFMGAGGIGDSNSTNWKVMLAGNKIGKPHGTVRYGDDEAALYENDDSLAEKDMGKVLPEDAVLKKEFQLEAPSQLGQVVKRIFWATMKGERHKSQFTKLVREKLAIHGMSYFHTSLDAALNSRSLILLYHTW